MTQKNENASSARRMMRAPRRRPLALVGKSTPWWSVAAALFLVLTIATPISEAAECPFLAKLGKSSDEVGGDLWELILGGAQPHSSSQTSESHRDLRRYDHYKSGSAYNYQRNRNQTVYSSLSDIWLCLACAVGWTVWLISATSTSQVEPSIYESQDSKKIHGNVLQVTLGEDPDGTGIPIYHTLVDYVVETDSVEEQHPMQVRKCFSTRKLFEEGFANVEVLVLLEDPTKSILMVDYIQEKNERNKQQLEPPDMIYAMIVYLIAAILIITSLVGCVHAYFKLDPEQTRWGKISLGMGTVLIYPIALLLYFVLSTVYRWAAPFVERPGVIIHGAQRYWNRKCGATLNPLEVMGTSFDGDTNNDIAEPSRNTTTRTGSNRIKRISPTHQQHRHKRSDTALSSVMELSHMTLSSTEGEENPANKQKRVNPSYPNAGCGFGNFNVLMPIRRTPEPSPADYNSTTDKNMPAVKNPPDYELTVKRSMSSISSVGSVGTGSTRAKSNAGVVASTSSLQMPNVMMDDSSYVLTNQGGLLGAAPTWTSSNLNSRPHGFVAVEYMPPPPSSMPRVRTESVSSSSLSSSMHQRRQGGATSPVLPEEEEPTPVASNVGVMQHISSAHSGQSSGTGGSSNSSKKMAESGPMVAQV
jgi:hypothetical protein